MNWDYANENLEEASYFYSYSYSYSMDMDYSYSIDTEYFDYY